MTPEEKEAKRRSEISKFLITKNAVGSRDELSPNGEFKLVITSFTTGKGSWNYTQGLVYRVGSDTPIFKVQRNYSSFPFSWVEHPNGHQYLICGENYQGQTVLELDTGRRKDFLPTEAKQGFGFCWVNHRFDSASCILTVDGCVWACPYEFRFYDFSDPMSGWPYLEIEDSYVDSDGQWPSFEADGTIKTFSTEESDDDDEVEGVPPPEPATWRATKTFKREGSKLILLSEEVSDEEKNRRVKNEAARKLYEERIAKFKTEDPLYLAYIELVKDPDLSPEGHSGVGITYDGWCPHFKVEEQRWCRRVRTHKCKTGITVDLEWGMSTGPIKVVIWKDGNHLEDKWFEHSVVGMHEAFKASKEAA
jgi:hypothetical protein